ncbi:hypothetical protein [Flavobacterium cerinum]|uniref:Uncharacterized protein n=1 Tax=Flavobacterium cerinum TaxID=2502784 RepID=A0A444HBN5_9FLAO|nr:hypothetical protein [Flavobacterium cerinum]RWX00884.1 hypothetical protein EPI11_07630 [Flavobacterium cerinum]
MARIKEEDFKNITQVEFDGSTYYAIEEIELDLRGIQSIELPIKGKTTKCATFEAIIAAKEDNKQLSEFDKNIIKGLNFNPKNKQ